MAFLETERGFGIGAAWMDRETGNLSGRWMAKGSLHAGVYRGKRSKGSFGKAGGDHAHAEAC